MDKNKIVTRLKEIVASRIEETQKEIDSINFSKENETKSSAGDKYETGMAMLQQEEEKAHAQMAKAQEFIRILGMLLPIQKNNSVQLGSLVCTNEGNFYLSFALGKINVEGTEIFVLSLGSPMGQQLKGKKANESFTFQNKRISIVSVE